MGARELLYPAPMSRVEERLAATARELAEKGDDAQRLELVQRARRFKRSWVEMAEAMVFVRDSRAYKRWGFEDFYDYCAAELQIRAPTVDKLVGSYATIRAHAPEVLQRDGVARTIPTVDAVDYFQRALEPANDREEAVDPDPEVLNDLRRAVFDDVKPVQSLRRQFNPLLHPKPEGAEERELIEKARTTVRRLTGLLGRVEGLSEARRQEVDGALSGLEQELAELAADPDARLAG